MSKQALDLLEAFDSLPADDYSGPLADEEIGETGKALFGFLDLDENAARPR